MYVCVRVDFIPTISPFLYYILPPPPLPSGSGTSVIYNEDMFVKRATVLKKYVDEDRELQVQILYALQVVVTKLEHPPSKPSTNTFVIPDSERLQWAVCFVRISRRL